MAIYIIIKKPYLAKSNNYRSAFNFIVMCGFVGLKTWADLSPKKQKYFQKTYPIIFTDLILLSVAIVYAFYSSLASFYY